MKISSCQSWIDFSGPQDWAVTAWEINTFNQLNLLLDNKLINHCQILQACWAPSRSLLGRRHPYHFAWRSPWRTAKCAIKSGVTQWHEDMNFISGENNHFMNGNSESVKYCFYNEKVTLFISWNHRVIFILNIIRCRRHSPLSATIKARNGSLFVRARYTLERR